MSLTVLVTGATGLLGREVLKAFKRAGWLSVGQGYTRAVPPTILKANLEDPKEIENLLNEARLDSQFFFVFRVHQLPIGPETLKQWLSFISIANQVGKTPGCRSL